MTDMEMVADNFNTERFPSDPRDFPNLPEYNDMINLRRGDKIVFSSVVRGLLGEGHIESEFMVWYNATKIGSVVGFIDLNEVRIHNWKLLEYLFDNDYRIVKSEGYDPLLFVD